MFRMEEEGRCRLFHDIEAVLHGAIVALLVVVEQGLTSLHLAQVVSIVREAAAHVVDAVDLKFLFILFFLLF